ncbi:hypothetical protein AMTRI_Chr12g267090 [Amborella trichopoda]
MEEAFGRSVESGLKLSKRLYYGRNELSGRRSAPFPAKMVEDSKHLFPRSPMVYSMISDPSIVDNPDIPSYQPHVYGTLDPPALIPLHMNRIEVDVNCVVNSAIFELKGSWRVHCVSCDRKCDCLLALPLHGEGSILGVEAEVSGRIYSTQLISMEYAKDFMGKTTKIEDGCIFNPYFFSITIPQVEGGSVLSLKVSWFQHLTYTDGHYSLSMPFSFPEFVIPSMKHSSLRERICVSVDSGNKEEVRWRNGSHGLQERHKEPGKSSFLYEAEVSMWSRSDFHFSYDVSSSNICGTLLLQPQNAYDFDQRQIFYLFLYPGSTYNTQVFRKDVLFLIDTSGSMRGSPLDDAKQAVSTALSMLAPGDSFGIIAFDEEIISFSTSLEFSTKEMIESACQWIAKRCVAGGGTNILQAVNEAMKMLSKVSHTSICYIFLITDGAVRDERNICHIMQTYSTNEGFVSPRICTFGVGAYCNHYFLRMLAMVGRGHYDAAYGTKSIDSRMQKLFTTAFCTQLTNISVIETNDLNTVEVYPCPIPDLSSRCPRVIFGRFHGKFPDSLKLTGSLPGWTNLNIDVKVQRLENIPFVKMLAKQHIDLLTAQAWFHEDKHLEEQVVKMSMHTGIPSEFTHMVLFQTEREKHSSLVHELKLGNKVDFSEYTTSKASKITFVHGLTVGFGSIEATENNIPIESSELNVSKSIFNIGDALNISVIGDCCCVCCGEDAERECSRLSNNCVIAMTQFCSALSCFACINCCLEVCCDDLCDM